MSNSDLSAVEVTRENIDKLVADLRMFATGSYLQPEEREFWEPLFDETVADQVGEALREAAAGIDQGGEFSYLAHLKKGSVTVKPGDKVERGEIIGQIGNSGNSSEPHLHFQVSGGSNLFESEAINVQWNDGSQPVQGEIINAD